MYLLFHSFQIIVINKIMPMCQKTYSLNISFTYISRDTLTDHVTMCDVFVPVVTRALISYHNKMLE
jgi:hypothetical protein